MPSTSAFMSNLSLSSATNSAKGANGILRRTSESQDAHTGEKQSKGVTGPLLLAAASSVISSALPAGYHIGVLNAPQEVIQNYCNQTVYDNYGLLLDSTQLGIIWSIIVSIFLVGAMVGSLMAGCLCNRFGRKGAMLLVNLLGLISALLFIGCSLVESVEMIIVSRFLIGICSGFSTSAVPMYLTEITPLNLRGPFGVLQPLGMTIGIVIALCLGLDTVLGTEWGWPYLLGISAIPQALGSIALFYCAESPKYLFIVKGTSEDAVRELSRLRGTPAIDLEDDLVEMKSELRRILKSPPWLFTRVLTAPEIRLPLILICLLHAGQQLSGINAVFYYSTGIFKNAGMSSEESQYASIGAGVANFLMAAVSTLLVSRFGRRSLFLTSSMLSMLCLGCLTVSFCFMEAARFVPYLAVVFLLSFVLLYGTGLGPIPYFIGSELFQSGPRPMAMSIGCTVNWMCNFLVGISFPTVQTVLGDYSFLLFVGISVFIWGFVYHYLPETHNKDFEQIRAQLYPALQEDDCGREIPAVLDETTMMQPGSRVPNSV